MLLAYLLPTTPGELVPAVVEVSRRSSRSPTAATATRGGDAPAGPPTSLSCCAPHVYERVTRGPMGRARPGGRSHRRTWGHVRGARREYDNRVGRRV